MIKNIFIPEQIKGYYLFSQKIIGLALQSHGVYATKAHASGSKVAIQEFKYEKLGFSPDQNYDEAIADSIKKVVKDLGSHSQVRLAMPSSLVIFKELSFPFLDTDKIRMVLGYEIEQFLPFPLDQAVYDFSVTSQNKKEKTTTILVAVTQQKHVSRYVSILTEAGISPHTIVVDILALFSFVTEIPKYQNLGEGAALIELGADSTTISYIQDNKLKLVRSINQGLPALASKEELEVALRYDKEENTDQGKELFTKINNFFNEIQFTFSAFQSQQKDFTPIKKALITGQAAVLNHLSEFATQKMSIPFECVETKELTSGKTVSLKKSLQSIAQEFMVSASVACPTKQIQEFNFLTTFFKAANVGVITKQLITALVLIVLIFGLFIGNTFVQHKRLSSVVKTGTKELISKLKTTFDITERSALTKPDRAVKYAQTKLEEEENLWFAFSKEARFSYLEYLQELSIRIDRESLGIKFKRLSMELEDGSITLEGEIKDSDFKSLTILEESLKESKLLQHSTIPQDMIQTDYNTKTTTFTVKIKVAKVNGE
ncbi:pilus assembly protein PilM [bacterium]|jgi:type IV pilus assembly protein PilM|nr:pilus assembly protein PilM [bacterium]MBT5015623.1 pilus assembly protein PilM [bacterium]